MSDPTPSRWRTALWRGETAPIPVVRTPTRAVYPRRRPVDDAAIAPVDHAVSLALRVGTLLLSGGAPTEDVEAAMFAVGTAMGLETFEVDITYNSIIISVAASGDRPALTDMRVVRGRSTHFARVAACHQLVVDLSEGHIEPGDVEARLSEIEHYRRPYARWFVIAAFGVLSAGITVQFGGNAITAAIAFVAAVATGTLGNYMSRHRVPTFFVNLVLALASTLIAVGVTAANDHLNLDIKVKTSLIIIGGIIALLPGMTLMVAAQEAISSFAVTAAARFVELTFATIGIVTGVLMGLIIAEDLDVILSVDIRATTETSVDSFEAALVSVAAAAIAAIAAAITYQSPRRLALLGGAVGALGIGLLLSVLPFINSPGVATAVPAVAIGIVASLVGLRTRVPPVLIVVPGIVPLLPGVAVFQGLLALTQDEPLKGIGSLIEALGVAIALAAGVLLGQLIGGRVSHHPTLKAGFRRDRLNGAQPS